MPFLSINNQKCSKAPLFPFPFSFLLIFLATKYAGCLKKKEKHDTELHNLHYNIHWIETHTQIPELDSQKPIFPKEENAYLPNLAL